MSGAVSHQIGGRLLFLDTWRLIAVTLVILAHLGLNKKFAGMMNSHGLGFYEYYGEVGVFIFFFISGFVVSKTCLDEVERTGDFSAKGFYIRRLYRIAPPLLFYLFGCALLAVSGLIYFSIANFFGAFTYLCNTSFVDCGQYAGHTWSLAFEEQFYLIFPILFSMVELQRRRLITVATVLPIVLLPFVFSIYWIGKTGFLIIYGLFLAGYLAARMPRLIRSKWLLPLGVAGAMIVFFPVPHFDSLFLGKFFKFLYLPAIPVMVLSTASGAINGAFSIRWVGYVGRATYSIYLWQQLFTGKLFSSMPPIQELSAIALMICACLLLFEMIERPLIRKGRDISLSLPGPRRTPANV